MGHKDGEPYSAPLIAKLKPPVSILISDAAARNLSVLKNT